MSVLTAPLLSRAQTEVQREYQSYSQEDAFNITTGAILKNPSVVSLLKNSEKWGWEQVRSIGVNEDYVRTTASFAAPFVYRKLSTRGFYMKWEPLKDVSVRPDLDYYFDTKVYNFSTSVLWRF